jgi:hypothetical protein
MSDPLTKIADATRDVERYIFERTVKPKITPEIIAEHKARPIGGSHSADLETVLRYLRRIPTKHKPRYVIIETKPGEEFALALHSRVRAAPLVLTGQRFATIEEAQHAIFLNRLRELEDDAVTRAVEAAST